MKGSRTLDVLVRTVVTLRFVDLFICFFLVFALHFVQYSWMPPYLTWQTLPDSHLPEASRGRVVGCRGGEGVVAVGRAGSCHRDGPSGGR